MSTKNLGELFREARKYGRVRISTYRDGKYSCSIEFEDDCCSIDAKSTLDEHTPESAVKKALNVMKCIMTVKQLEASQLSQLEKSPN